MATMLMVGGLLLSACTYLETAPKRPFTTMELLISLSEMPPGWTVSDPPKELRDDISTEDASITIFQADTDFPRRGATHRVYQYRNRSSAKAVYEEFVLPTQLGNTPAEWAYQSTVSDQSYFACYDYEGREPLHCQWSARYEEYIVAFSSWLIPGRMSLQDMERVVRAIDARMAQYLDKPYEDVSVRP